MHGRRGGAVEESSVIGELISEYINQMLKRVQHDKRRGEYGRGGADTLYAGAALCSAGVADTNPQVPHDYNHALL